MTTVADDIVALQSTLDQLQTDQAAETAGEESRYKDVLTQLKTAQDTVAAEEAQIAALKAQVAALMQTVSPFPDMPTLSRHDEFTGNLGLWDVRDGLAAKNERSIRWARNVSVQDGKLVIQPHLEQSTVGSTTRSYTSGEVVLKEILQAPFAVEISARMPLATGKCAGFWPALWSRGTGPGEIDWYEGFELGLGATSNAIAEAPHGKLTSHIYSDSNTGAGKAGILSSTVYDMTVFNRFVGRVDADGSVSTYFNGTLIKRYPVSQYPYLATAFGGYDLRITLQIGSSYYGVPDANVDWSQNLAVDYVRVWKP